MPIPRSLLALCLLLCCLEACISPHPSRNESVEVSEPLTAKDLLEKKWVVISISNYQSIIDDDIPLSQKNISFKFSADAKTVQVNGYGGCNQFSSSCIIDQQNIVFRSIISTKRACPELALENAFFNALKDASHFEVERKGRGKFVLHLKQIDKVLVSCEASETKKE